MNGDKLHMNDTVEFDYGPDVTVSTLCTVDRGWETCLFYEDGDINGSAHSTVVARYLDVEAAVIGHHAFLQRDVLSFISLNRNTVREA